MFKERPGGGAREANGPPDPPAPLVQLRAMCPKRPQFWNNRVCLGTRSENDDAHVALLTSACLNPQTRALGLDMSNSTTGVTLLGSNRAGLRAGRGLVSRLATVVAQPLLRSTVFRDMAHYWGSMKMLACKILYHVQLPHLKQPFLENWYAIFA